MHISECSSRLFSRYPLYDWIFPYGAESCLFISSLAQPISESRQQNCGGWEGREGNAKGSRGVVEGNLLNLETIKGVSSALCLVWCHMSAVLGFIQGHDNTHYSHYLPGRPINSRGHDKVPLSEMLRLIRSSLVSDGSKCSNGSEEMGGEWTARQEKSPEGTNCSHFQRGGGTTVS